MKILKLLFIWIISMAFVHLSYGQNNSVKKFYNCWSLFVGGLVPETNMLLQQVKSGSISGAKACVELLKKAKLDPVTGLLINESPLSIKILNNIYAHFLSRPVSQNLYKQSSQKSYIVVRNIYANEPALYYLKAFFTSSLHFNYVLTGQDTLLGKRDHRTSIKDPYYNDSIQFSNLATSITPQHLVGLGPLRGVEVDTRNIVGMDKFGGQQQLIQHFGAGVMGTISSLTERLEGKTEQNGGGRIPRTWAKHFLESMTCRSFPLLRSEDVTQFVQTNSNLPFRQNQECLRCHASMDPAAAVTRNILLSQTGGMGKIPVLTQITPQGSPDWSLPPNGDPGFYQKPPAGAFRMRSIQGNLHSFEALGLQDFGEKLSLIDDIYACEAKMLFEYLTGFEVPFFDPGQVNAPQRSLQEAQALQFIIQVGQQLKHSGNPIEAMGNIIKSSYF